MYGLDTIPIGSMYGIYTSPMDPMGLDTSQYTINMEKNKCEISYDQILWVVGDVNFHLEQKKNPKEKMKRLKKKPKNIGVASRKNRGATKNPAEVWKKNARDCWDFFFPLKMVVIFRKGICPPRKAERFRSCKVGPKHQL